MKKGFTIIALLLLSVTVSLASFNDLSQSHWAYESVMYLTELGIISGMPDGSFRGNDPMTRYQSAVAMKRLLDFSNAHTGVNTSIPSDFQNRLAELEILVDRSLKAVEKVGKDYRGIMEKLGNTAIEPANSGLQYEDLEVLIEEILEMKLDSKNIEGTINETRQAVEVVKNENQEILTQLDMNDMARAETAERLKELDSKINTYRWISISSAVIAVGSLIMAGFSLLK